MKEKKNKGITLIALVITIIVLLILAGVTLSTLFGNNGILTESKLAVEANKEANAKEQVQLAWTACETEYQAAWTQDSSVVKKDYFDADDLNKNLGTGTVKSVGYVEKGKSTVTYTLDGTEYEFEIANGQVYKVGQAPDVTEPIPSEPERVDGSSADWEFDAATGTILSMKLNDSGIYRNNTSTVVIPSTIDGIKVKKIGRLYEDDLGGSFGIGSGGEYLNKIIISDGIEEIGGYAFLNCEASEFVIPDSVVTIGEHAFENCYNINTITIPGSVKVLSGWIFLSCENLNSIVLSEGIEELGPGVFEGCEELRELNIPSTMKKVDPNCFVGAWGSWNDRINLDRINVSDENKTYDDRGGNNVLVETATNKVILGAYDSVLTADITTIGNGAFENMNLNERFSIPDSVTEIENSAFSYANLPTSLSLTNVTSIGEYAFECCEGLISVTLGNKLTTIEDYAFSGSSLTDIRIPSSVISIGKYAFSNNQTITIQSGSPLSTSSPDYPWGADTSKIHFE